MSSSPSFYWHDYETSGVDSRRDRAVQFAGQRTNCELEPVGEPLVIYCKPASDVLPQPGSCLVTGITPQQADRDGVIEAEFAARIHEEFSVPGTCCVGFNSIRFDDEFTRNLLYRNFYDPYAREWENGNSRWDVIDLARMCYALRPAGIQWPLRKSEERVQGRALADSRAQDARTSIVPSFRLEDLTAANNLAHRHAHDALSDVQATIDLARLLRSRQPRLFDFYFALRRKQRACELLDFAHRTPVLHVSSRYPAERGCLAMIVPLAQHPTQPNKIIVYDLDADPTALLAMEADEIADRVFTPRADLPEDVERIPLKAVSVNRSPALAPLSALAGVDTARIGLDRERCLAHLQLLQDAADLPGKLRHVFATPKDEAVVDPELAIYRGFADDRDRDLLRRVRATPSNLLGQSSFTFRDARYAELLFRYRARNWPETLALDERERWEQFRLRRLREHSDLSHASLDGYFAEIAQLREIHAADPHKTPLLDALEQWGHQLAQG
jgi:exodeoxyribonuclease-1